MIDFLIVVFITALLIGYLEVKYREQQHQNDSQELQGRDDDAS